MYRRFEGLTAARLVARLAVLDQTMVVIRKGREQASCNGDAGSSPEGGGAYLNNATSEVVVDQVLGQLHCDHGDDAHACSGPAGNGPG